MVNLEKRVRKRLQLFSESHSSGQVANVEFWIHDTSVIRTFYVANYEY